MSIRVLSYNCRGMRLGMSAGDKACRIVIDRLLEECDIDSIKKVLEWTYS